MLGVAALVIILSVANGFSGEVKNRLLGMNAHISVQKYYGDAIEDFGYTLKMLEDKNRKKLGGSIINMSSQMGHVGGPIRSVYNMTKFGLEGLTKGMAIDLAKNNIRVNSVCPTFLVTPMTKKFLKNKKFKKNMLKNIPLGRFADVSDVATAVTFLASDASSMITGTSILIDGGWTAQ